MAPSSPSNSASISPNRKSSLSSQMREIHSPVTAKDGTQNTFYSGGGKASTSNVLSFSKAGSHIDES